MREKAFFNKIDFFPFRVHGSNISMIDIVDHLDIDLVGTTLHTG